MPSQLTMRLASLLVTAAVWLAVDHRHSVFQWITYSMGFVHYALSARYSTRQLGQATSTLPQSLALLALIFVALSLYFDNRSLVVYFGIHHACNEAFRRASEGPRPSPATAFFLQATAFAFVLRHDASFAAIDDRILTAALAVATLVCAKPVMAQIRSVSASRLANIWAAELAAIALVVASLVFRVEFLHVVLYHFVLWALLPLQQMQSRGHRALASYIAATLLMTCGVMLISPVGPDAFRVSALRFTQLFLLLSYAHITLSFALSDAHPEWMIRMFRSAPRQLADATS